jgi:hypothetical protein
LALVQAGKTPSDLAADDETRAALVPPSGAPPAAARLHPLARVASYAGPHAAASAACAEPELEPANIVAGGAQTHRFFLIVGAGCIVAFFILLHRTVAWALRHAYVVGAVAVALVLQRALGPSLRSRFAGGA